MNLLDLFLITMLRSLFMRLNQVTLLLSLLGSLVTLSHLLALCFMLGFPTGTSGCFHALLTRIGLYKVDILAEPRLGGK